MLGYIDSKLEEGYEAEQKMSSDLFNLRMDRLYIIKSSVISTRDIISTEDGSIYINSEVIQAFLSNSDSVFH